jgi:hypothetical protein
LGKLSKVSVGGERGEAASKAGDREGSVPGHLTAKSGVLLQPGQAMKLLWSGNVLFVKS